MSNEFLEVTRDKFTFRVKTGYHYHADECWVKNDGGLVTVGITDFFQRTVGDMIYIDLLEIGTKVALGDEAGMIETIKVNVTVISPIRGTIKEVNEGLKDNPQWVNSDPYGTGWLYKITPDDWEADAKGLLEARAYFSKMEEKIENEMAKN